MRHSLKIALRIVYKNEIYFLCESRISLQQIGYRNGLGTRKPIFWMLIFLQKSCEFRKYVYVCNLQAWILPGRVLKMNVPKTIWMVVGKVPAFSNNLDSRLNTEKFFDDKLLVHIEISHSTFMSCRSVLCHRVYRFGQFFSMDIKLRL